MNNLLLNNKSKGPGAAIYFCKVIRFYASSNTADVVTIDNNISLLGCNIACSMPAGFVYGTRYIPSHDDKNSEVEYVNSPGDVYCIAAFLENDYNNSAILGFLFPLQTTLSIDEYGLYIFRHESDVIWMVRGDGTMQIYHPSGSIIKIGDNDINEVSSDIEQDGLYPAKTDGMHIRSADDYNKDKASNLFIRWYQGQKVTLNSTGDIILQTRDAAATLTMTPDGKVTIETTEQINAITKDINIIASGDVVANVVGNVTATVQGNVVTAVSGDVSVDAAGSTIVNAGGDVSVRAPTAKVDVVANEVGIDSPLINLITTNPGGLTINGVPGVTGNGNRITSINGIVTRATG